MDDKIMTEHERRDKILEKEGFYTRTFLLPSSVFIHKSGKCVFTDHSEYTKVRKYYQQRATGNWVFAYFATRVEDGDTYLMVVEAPSWGSISTVESQTFGDWIIRQGTHNFFNPRTVFSFCGKEEREMDVCLPEGFVKYGEMPCK